MLLATPRTHPTEASLLEFKARDANEEQRLSRQQRKEMLAKNHKQSVLASRGGGDTCILNMEHLGSALDSYRFDHATYPTQLQQLVPDYIDHLPTCPKQGKETYSHAYRVSRFGFVCELGCTGCDDTPKYQSSTGFKYRGYWGP